jgi:hypothetical protein
MPVRKAGGTPRADALPSRAVRCGAMSLGPAASDSVEALAQVEDEGVEVSARLARDGKTARLVRIGDPNDTSELVQDVRGRGASLGLIELPADPAPVPERRAAPQLDQAGDTPFEGQWDERRRPIRELDQTGIRSGPGAGRTPRLGPRS